MVDVGGSSDGDSILTANDFTNPFIGLVGVIDMTAADYANFGTTNLVAAF